MPPELEALIREGLRASRLPPVTRTEVERELRAHFEDGLEAGISAETLSGRFGDPAQAGKLIAKSRRKAARGPNTGRWWMSPREWWDEVRRAARRLGRRGSCLPDLPHGSPYI